MTDEYDMVNVALNVVGINPMVIHALVVSIDYYVAFGTMSGYVRDENGKKYILDGMAGMGLFFNECEAFRSAVVGGGYRNAVCDALIRSVEQTGRRAVYCGIDGVVRLGEFRRRFRFHIVLRLFIGSAFGALRDADALCATAVAVIVAAVFLTAFEIVHNISPYI